MSDYTFKSVVIMTFFMLSSCTALQPLNPKEAFIARPCANTRLLLERAIGDLLNSKPIKLADNVFLQNSTVVIERNQPKNSQGNLLNGREMRKADTISLLTEDGKYYLKHEQSGRFKHVNIIGCEEK